SATPPPSAQTASNAADQITGDVKSRAVSLLKDARTALARGDNFTALAAWQKAAAMGATFAPNEDSTQRVADDLVRAGIDPSRLRPANLNPASPYALRPSDIDSSAERLPQLGAPGVAPPAGAAPTNASPYNLPPEPNPRA